MIIQLGVMAIAKRCCKQIAILLARVTQILQNSDIYSIYFYKSCCHYSLL